MNNSIKQTQLTLLMLLVISGGKFLSLPGLMAQFSGRDSWISMTLLFAVDLVCLCFILWAIKLNKGKRIDEIFEQTLTPVGAKIIFLLYAAFFILRIMGGLIDTMDLMLSSLSVVTNWVAFILPMLSVIGFNVLKGLRNVGRLTQIFFIFIFVSVLLILFLSCKHADFGNLKPYVADGFGIVAKGALDASFWFGDCVFLVLLMGKVTTNKGFVPKIAGAFVFGAILTVMLDVVFLSLFGMLAKYSTSALAKVSGFNLTSSSYGRLDWVFVVIWLSSIIIKSTLFLWGATTSLGYVFNVKKQRGFCIIFAVISLAFVALPLIVPVKSFITQFICGGAGKYIFFVVQYLIPLLLPLLTYLSNKKGGQRSVDETEQEESTSQTDAKELPRCFCTGQNSSQKYNDAPPQCFCADENKEVAQAGGDGVPQYFYASNKQYAVQKEQEAVHKEEKQNKGLFYKVKRLWKKITAKKA